MFPSPPNTDHQQQVLYQTDSQGFLGPEKGTTPKRSIYFIECCLSVCGKAPLTPCEVNYNHYACDPTTFL